VLPNKISAGAPPRAPLGELTAATPDPLAGFKGPISKGREKREGKEGMRALLLRKRKGGKVMGKGRVRKEEKEGRKGKKFNGLMSNCFLRNCPGFRAPYILAQNRVSTQNGD